ncbi:hypothetical protein ACX2XI_000186 [Klebsiella variicola]
MSSKLTSEILDDETLAELIAFRRSRVEYCPKEGLPYQKALHDSMMLALEELQERRKADSEPVATLDVQSGRPDGHKFSLAYSSVAHKLPDDVYFLYRHAQPVPVVPDAYVRDERGRMILNGVCEPKIGFGTDWNACRAAMLKAQPQNAPQNIPEIIPGWIPVSEQKPDCWCRTCRPVVLNDMRFVVCPDCGNKRCPRGNDHRNACTGSNEPGQEGSAYPVAPQEVKGE